jgi:HlyD family secretion protein
MEQAQQNIQKLRVTSPIDGLVAVQKNAGDFAFSAMSSPDFHEGDQARAGAAIAQVIDSRDMELIAKVSEIDRANISVGQPAEIEFDALAGEVFRGVLKSAGAMVQRNWFWEDQGSKYDISIQLTNPDPHLRPGLTAHITILGDKKANALFIPRQALFQKEGTQTVFVKKGLSFKQLAVKVDSENESWAAIEGLEAGEEVALIDPTAPRKSSTSVATSALGGGTP